MDDFRHKMKPSKLHSQKEIKKIENTKVPNYTVTERIFSLNKEPYKIQNLIINRKIGSI